MKKALKILRKIIFWIFFISLFITTCITVILYVYEDEIKQYAVDELNSYLTTEFQAQDIELSFFHDFPSASIQFKNVFIADAYPNIQSDDTLFYAGSMFFNFNLWDIYSGNYQVKRVSIHDGGLFLKTAEDGQTNFDIIKPQQDDSEDAEEFEFLLELLEVENVALRYRNLASSQFYDLQVHKGLFQGNFSADNYTIQSESSLHINRLKSNSLTMVSDKEADLQMSLEVNSLAKKYDFTKGDLTIEKMPFHITGYVDSSVIDMAITGNNIQLHDLANSLVEESMQEVKLYEGHGEINFTSHIHGPLSSVQMPAIEADFDISGGSMTDPSSNLSISDVSFLGHYKNQQEHREEQLHLENVYGKLLQSYFKGEATITNFAQPKINLRAEGDLDLAKFHQFFKPATIEKLAGHTQFNCTAELQFLDPERNKKSFDVQKSDGHFYLNAVQYKATNDPLFYQEISGELILNDKDAAAKQLQIRTAKSDVLINGAMKNLVAYLDGTGNLGLIASLESNNIDLNEFMQTRPSSDESHLEVFALPNNLNLNVDMDIRNLNWVQTDMHGNLVQHNYKNITAKMLMANRTVKMQQIDLNTAGGKVRGNMKFQNGLENGNVIDGKLWFSGIDMNRLFEEWKNFDQNSITHEHLTGIASGEIDLRLMFNPYFSILEDKIHAACNLNIQNGRLDNLETMRSITDYMRTNKGLKMLLKKHIDHFEDKLMHIQFSDIENTITIKDRRLTIPRMKIKSSALDIELFGWHDFDNQIEYHFSFRFRDLKEQITENEFGVVEDDGLGLVIYLKMYGDLFDPSFELDKSEIALQIKEDMKQEGQTIKSIFKTEFGAFKNDTTVQQIHQDNKNEIEFIIYDEDQEEMKDTIVKDEKKNKKHTLKLFENWKKEAEKKNQNKIDYEQDGNVE